ncbi:hypothetical protein V7111_19140 [Neobacillus niacini]|uniref:hypothetical protein n=1 Tax=Neobacillus niacini TaxID=86668 RepID=UPI003002B011
MTLTAAHWIFALVTLVIIVAIIFRRGVVVPTLVGTFIVAWIYKGSIVGGFTAVFNANLVAAKELFSIFLIMTFMIALLNSLKGLGSDKLMIAPIQKFMVNGHVAYFVLIGFTYIISLFFWPTPAVPLICALLVPAAVRAGLPVMGAAVAVALAGQGMALASDYVMQVVPMVSATAAGVEPGIVANKSLVLSLITGLTAIAIAYARMHKQISKPNSIEVEKELTILQGMGAGGQAANELAVSLEQTKPGKDLAKWGKGLAIIVPLTMLGVVIIMISTKFSGGRMGGLEGGDGAAFIGGVAAFLLILANFAKGGLRGLDKIGDFLIEGFVTSFRVMGAVIPIAGFFFLGSSDFTGSILSLGEEAAKPAFLFDLVQSAQTIVPQSGILTAFGILLVGIITGLDGSGFAGLTLAGSLSGAMAEGAGLDASTLAAIGQVGTIFTGGGTLVAWSSLVAVAGFCGVSAFELARKNFLPVIIGLILSTILALLIW